MAVQVILRKDFVMASWYLVKKGAMMSHCEDCCGLGLKFIENLNCCTNYREISCGKSPQ